MSANIRAEMARLGINNTQLAVRLGWSFAAVSRRLRVAQSTPWKADELPMVAAALGVPVTKFYEGIEPEASETAA